MKKNVVLYSKIPSDQQARLVDEFNLTIFDRSPDGNKKDFIKALANAEGMIGSNMASRVDDNFLALTPKLKVASTISVGFDNYDLDALKKRKIRLMNTPTVLTEGTADLIFTLLMATARRTAELSKFIHDGKWVKSITTEYYGSDIYVLDFTGLFTLFD